MSETKTIEHQNRELLVEVQKLKKTEFRRGLLILSVGFLSSIAGALIALNSLAKDLDVRVLNFLLHSELARVAIAAIAGALASAVGFKGIIGRLRRPVTKEDDKLKEET